MAIFAYVCVCALLFQLSVSVSWSLEMQISANTPKHGVAHNPMLHSGHLNFVLVALFLAKHAQQPISKTSVCCNLCQVCLVV